MAAEGGADKTAAAPQVVAPSTEERLVAWLQANRTPVIIGAAAVALVVAVTWFLAAASARKENFARTQLEQAWGAADAGNAPLAASELQKVVDSYGGTDAAVEARLSLNETRLSAGQSQLAADDLAALVASGPERRFLAQANMLLGAAYENLGKGADAAAAFEAASAAAEMDYLKAEALLGAARAFRSAGQNDRAIATLQAILERYKETAAFSVAEVRLGEIQKGS
jgi:predicted negative regulator of RcsB-dependent stress response